MNTATELEMLRAASQASRTGAWKWALDTDTIVWTDMTHELFEVPRGTQIGLEIGLSFYDDESKLRLVPAVEACRETVAPWDLIARCRTAIGRWFWARLVGVAVRDDHDRIVALEGASRSSRTPSVLSRLPKTT
jgi:hypothetical protein